MNLPPPPSIEIPQLSGTMSLERFFAFMIDQFIAVVLTLTVAVQVRTQGEIVSWSAMIATYYGYFLLSETLLGNTFGKWSMGLCIRSLDGKKCTYGQALIRSILRIVDVNPILGALPAAAAILATKRRQRLGDMLAGTVVLRRASLPG
jgi:uncharacterized RDD family membrane protein YckC